MKINIFPILILIFSITSCNNKEENNRNAIPASSNKLTRIWKAVDFVYDATINDHLNDDKLSNKTNFDLQKKQYIYLNKGFYLYLFPDGKSVKIIDTLYELGNWDYNNHNKSIDIIKPKGTDHFEIKEFYEEDGNKYIIIQIGKKQELKMIEQYKMVDNFTLNPFYPTNNQWRIKPSEAETTLELKNRLLNYILHYKHLFRIATERNSKHISLHCSKGIVQIYDGGIGFVKWYKIAPEWKNTYFNDKDATDGYNIYKDYLDNTILKVKSDENLIKKNYNLLSTIHQKIQADIKLNYN